MVTGVLVRHLADGVKLADFRVGHRHAKLRGRGADTAGNQQHELFVHGLKMPVDPPDQPGHVRLFRVGILVIFLGVQPHDVIDQLRLGASHGGLAHVKEQVVVHAGGDVHLLRGCGLQGAALEQV